MSRPTMTRGPLGPGGSAGGPAGGTARGPDAGRPAAPAPTRPANPPAAPPQVSGRARFAARARAVRRASWRWRILVPLLLLLVVGGWWFVYSGPVLVLKDVAVRGVPAATAEQVRAAARLPMGEQLARIDLAAARQRVAAICIVRTAEISRSWPSTVTISVTLRVPVAVVQDSQGGLHLADSTGTAYADLTSAPPGLPQVQADANDPAAVQSVVQVLSALPRSLRTQVDTAAAKDGADSVTLKLGRVTVAWGSADDSALKVRVLEALRTANPTARHFDLSAPRSPSVG